MPGFLTYRELDEVPCLTDPAATALSDGRRVKTARQLQIGVWIAPKRLRVDR